MHIAVVLLHPPLRSESIDILAVDFLAAVNYPWLTPTTIPAGMYLLLLCDCDAAGGDDSWERHADCWVQT